MRDRWGRAGAITGLLMAILHDLSRGAWWAYRPGSRAQPPRTSIVARRPLERHQHVPKVTPAWQPLAGQALPVQAVAAARSMEGELLPIAWLDAAERPDLTDLPRVLTGVRGADERPVVATQWLADPAAGRIVLVVTFVEPVTCSWAMRFAWPHARTFLELVLASGSLLVVVGDIPRPPSAATPLAIVSEPDARASILLPISSLVQLHAIMDSLTAES